MRTKQVNYKMHLGQPSVPGTAWNGYESYWPDGTPALGQHEALYNVGSGQWHKDMEFQDPYFTSTGDMLLRYLQATGKHPTYDAAACVAAGISLVYSLEGYGQSLLAMNKSQRREEIREGLVRSAGRRARIEIVPVRHWNSRSVSPVGQIEALCQDSEGSTYAVWPLIVALIFCIVVLVIVYKFATKVDRSSRDAVATILFSTGLIVATLQAFPAFSKVEVQWIEPLKTLKGVFAFLTFDLTMIRPGCWMGERNAFTSYLFAILVYPAGCAFFCSVLGFAKYVLKKDITLNDLINALSSLSVRPFKCVGNPDSTSSMANDRGTICWTSGTHQAMVALALVPILGGVLPFMSVMIWAVTQYGRRVARPGGVKFVKRWAFAFARFNASGCYFALVVVLRDFIIGVSPAVFVSFNELLFLIYVLTLASYATLQARIWPWKTSMANFLDSGLALTLVTTVVLGSTLLNFDVARGTVVIQILSMPLGSGKSQ
eukprot:g33155.t1